VCTLCSYLKYINLYMKHLKMSTQVQWFHENFEERENSLIFYTDFHNQYEKHCISKGLEARSSASYGKLIKAIFPSINRYTEFPTKQWENYFVFEGKTVTIFRDIINFSSGKRILIYGIGMKGSAPIKNAENSRKMLTLGVTGVNRANPE